jgi:hypothetical protein
VIFHARDNGENANFGIENLHVGRSTTRLSSET